MNTTLSHCNISYDLNMVQGWRAAAREVHFGDEGGAGVEGARQQLESPFVASPLQPHFYHLILSCI